MLGLGSYFAENASKSDQYSVNGESTERHMLRRRSADSDIARQADTNTRFSLFVVRVCMGKPFLTSSTAGCSQYRKPPRDGKSEYDSVLYHPGVDSEGEPRHREFVVYDHNACYPEFLVEYTRKKSI